MAVLGVKRSAPCSPDEEQRRPVRKAAKKARAMLYETLVDPDTRIMDRVASIERNVFSLRDASPIKLLDLRKRMLDLEVNMNALKELTGERDDVPPVATTAYDVALSSHEYFKSPFIVKLLSGQAPKKSDTWEVPPLFFKVARAHLCGRLERGRRIGLGGSCDVCEVPGFPELVVKRLKSGRRADFAGYLSVMRERSLSAFLKGGFPTCVYANFKQDPGHLYFEKVTGTDVLTRLSENREYPYEEFKRDLRGWLKCLIELHDLGLVHMDIKLDNLMPGKVIDLGCVQVVGEGGDVGCVGASPPEALKKHLSVSEENVAEKEQDMWKLGAALFRVYDPDCRFFYDATDNKFTQEAVDQVLEELEQVTKNKELVEILRMLLRVDPKERVSARALYTTLYGEES